MGEDHGYIDRNSCLAVTHYWCTYLFGYPSIQQSEFGTNEYRNAQKLYLKYEQINQELTHKIDQLEEEVKRPPKPTKKKSWSIKESLLLPKANGIFAGRKSGAERIAASESSAWDAWREATFSRWLIEKLLIRQ